ncbi:MAG: CrcB family protein [Chlorobi bacterium]|nr:CrcB family protein [Chlorobiota bacterium]MCI0716533.1 CrcB family protein [Chlorobiota bacterium]
MLQILYIGLGGFVGAVSRFLVSRYLSNLLPSFPLGTLVVNIAGSFVLGFIVYSAALGKNISSDVRDFITIGVLGDLQQCQHLRMSHLDFLSLTKSCCLF